jgi:hypothetical protein
MTARDTEVVLRGIGHILFALGVAALCAWLSDTAEFVPMLVAVTLAHSAYVAAEREVPRC